jgi:hypothetical protein
MIKVQIPRAQMVEFTDNAMAVAYTHARLEKAGIPMKNGAVSGCGSLWLEIDHLAEIIIWRWYADDETIPDSMERAH